MFSVALAFCAFVLPARAADEKPADPKTPLPSASEILERFGKAVGGQAAFMKHNSQHARGSVEMPAQKLKGTMEVFAARPNKLVLKVSIPGIGETATGYDGKVAWANNPLLGPMLLEGKSRDQIATQADFDQALHHPDHYKTKTVLGVEQFNGEECYKLKLVHRSGFESTEYFSVKTGLQRGFEATQESPLGPITATSLVTDYKQFGDLFMPSRITQKAMGVETVMTIQEMEYDKVDPAVFDLPEPVKALLEKPDEKTDLPGRAPKKEPAEPVKEPAGQQRK
jgi:zinc protease